MVLINTIHKNAKQDNSAFHMQEHLLIGIIFRIFDGIAAPAA